ncbi:hypothetical protein OIU76_026669, partial [Salix suchowensis]
MVVIVVLLVKQLLI